MKPISTNSVASPDEPRDTRDCRVLRDQSSDNENCATFPDAHLASGLLLTLVLFAIYCVSAGGVFVIVIAACVVIVGLGLGSIWKRYFPYQVCGLNNHATNLETRWSKGNDKKIFFDAPLIGCY